MTELADIGVVGLGVMGANLSLNLAEKGFRVATYDSDGSKRAAMQDSNPGRFVVCASEEALLAAIRPPRPVILLVPAGSATDAALGSLAGLASTGDLLIDAGNADFHDTRRRTADLEARGLSFLGMGVSGGAEGARHGPAIMAGGTRKSWDRVEPMLSKIAAKFQDEPCAGWLGPDGAGHFVKTVHNGIEYADMQMIAEIYGLMRDGAGTSDAEIAEIFSEWSQGPLASYLVEITAEVAASTDAVSGQPLLSIIADRAGQKGTGRWSIIAAQLLGAAATTVEAAVAARNLSAATSLRGALSTESHASTAFAQQDLHDALHAGKIIAYAQGFDLLTRASAHFGWDLALADIGRLWRAGCIIRSSMLEDVVAAFEAEPDSFLLSATAFRERILPLLPALRGTVSAATLAGLPVPALSNSIAYVDQLSRPRGTANLLQGLRDYFGQHGFERTDREGGGFHGPWVSEG